MHQEEFDSSQLKTEGFVEILLLTLAIHLGNVLKRCGKSSEELIFLMLLHMMHIVYLNTNGGGIQTDVMFSVLH